MAEIDWKKRPVITRRPQCTKCYGRGVHKNGMLYVKCTCGRLPDSWGAKKLAAQAELLARFENLKVKGW